MQVIKILDHVVRAKKRLLEQYKGKPNIEALIESLVKPLQDLEDSFFDLIEKRYLNTAEGFQLDRLGEIVGIDRNGLDDEKYRLRIRARILVNISNGEPEALIQIYKLLTLANLVVAQEDDYAGVALMSDGLIADQDDVDTIYALLEAAAAAGVRVEAIGYFDDLNPFAFDGPVLPLGGGFGDATNPATGGKFGELYVIGPEFAFAGGDPRPGGFGTVEDPLVGGRFVGL